LPFLLLTESILSLPAELILKAAALIHHGWGLNMPLVKSSSPKAFRSNVKAEVAAGKPVKQAVAIAYSVKREAKPAPAPMKKK
jgi:hypothetical protein